MANTNVSDFLLENRLRKLNPELHQRFTDTVVSIRKILFRFRKLFPEYTDHSGLHSMTVLDFCNRLIGPEQVMELNADSIYTLLMGCYLHDIGMGISEEQYEEFRKEISFGDYFAKHPDAKKEHIIRDFHQEFSAAFIRKYAHLLEIPSSAHEFAIIEVCRGHRRTDLFDVSLFPPHFTVPGGNEIPLPYLAALIRLADEIDVVAARNPIMLYDMESFTDAVEIAHHKRHEAVKELVFEEDAFILHAVHSDEDIDRMITDMRDKMEMTLLYCREAARKQSSFRITQKEVRILYLD